MAIFFGSDNIAYHFIQYRYATGVLLIKCILLQTIESPEFVELVRYLNPTKKIFSCRELARKNVKRHEELKENRFFKNVNHPYDVSVYTVNEKKLSELYFAFFYTFVPYIVPGF